MSSELTRWIKYLTKWESQHKGFWTGRPHPQFSKMPSRSWWMKMSPAYLFLHISGVELQNGSWQDITQACALHHDGAPEMWACNRWCFKGREITARKKGLMGGQTQWERWEAAEEDVFLFIFRDSFMGFFLSTNVCAHMHAVPQKHCQIRNFDKFWKE